MLCISLRKLLNVNLVSDIWNWDIIFHINSPELGIFSKGEEVKTIVVEELSIFTQEIQYFSKPDKGKQEIKPEFDI